MAEFDLKEGAQAVLTEEEKDRIEDLFDNTEKAQAPKAQAEAPKAQAEAPDASYDVEIDNMEWEVETEPAEPEEETYEPQYYEPQYREQAYEDDGRLYGRNRFGRRVRVARFINKHLFTWVFSFMLGMYGGDRFVRGQVGLGLLKLLTFGGFGFWYLADLMVAMGKSYSGEYKYDDNVLFDNMGEYVSVE